jgi:hypothetical protein
MENMSRELEDFLFERSVAQDGSPQVSEGITGSNCGASYTRSKKHGDSIMTETPRITVDELRKRMEAGEDFTVIDVCKPERWQQSDTMIPEAIRVPLDKVEDNLVRIPTDRPIVVYCT